MLVSSPVAAIYQVLQQVQANATANASIFQKNEAATRAALIDPVLRALGWDTANVRMVEPEKTLSNELRIDYLLNDPNGNPWIVVEAKCLGSSLDKYGYVGKILGYAISLNVHTVCITDGVTWHIHSHLQNGKPEPIVFTLADNDFLLAANELIRWLDAAQCGHGILPASEKAVVAPPPERLLTEPVPKQPAKPKQQMQFETGFTNVAQVHLLKLLPGQKPKQLRLPNGTVKPITNWKDILVEVCQLVLATNSRLPIPFPDKAGKKRYLISSEKQPIGGSTAVEYKGKPVFVGTNYSAAVCIANALHVAKQLPSTQRTHDLAVNFG